MACGDILRDGGLEVARGLLPCLIPPLLIRPALSRNLSQSDDVEICQRRVSPLGVFHPVPPTLPFRAGSTPGQEGIWGD